MRVSTFRRNLESFWHLVGGGKKLYHDKFRGKHRFGRTNGPFRTAIFLFIFSRNPSTGKEKIY